MVKNWRRILATVATLLVAGTSTAYIKRGKDMTLEQLTRAADAVVLGRCTGKSTRWVRGHIETDYEIVVSEKLKGSKSFNPGATVHLTVMGGESTTPPITQYTELQVHMYKGEEVALFLRTTPAGTEKARERAARIGSKLLTTPRVVGMNEGKFTVVVDETDGRRKLTRVNLENYGFMPQDMVLQRVLRAVARREVTVTDQPVVELGGGLVTSPEGKALIDAAAAGSKAPVSVAPAPDEKSDPGSQSVIRTIRRGSPIPLQDLEEFKNQVRQFAN